MPLRILIAPDKFKGTLSAPEAAAAMACGWGRARPEDRLELLPVSDGGDGFGEAVSRLLGAREQTVETVDAAHRPCLGRWWWEAHTATAIVESAAIIGLAMLPRGRFHPFELDTFGLGAVLRAAAAKGAQRCLMGIGGSATNDGGFGAARALGWRFLGPAGSAVNTWTGLMHLKQVQPPRRRRWFRKFIVAVDVQNPLLGARGATRVYGPQKGLKPADFAKAERCLKQLARVAHTQFGRDFSRQPGAGAAGGLGFGLPAFLGAELTPGFDLFGSLSGLDRRIRSSDCVLTGEGAIDRSTLMGKGVGELAKRCRALRKPCLALAGVVTVTRLEAELFSSIRVLSELTTPADARAHAAAWLEQATERAAREIQISGTPAR